MFEAGLVTSPLSFESQQPAEGKALGSSACPLQGFVVLLRPHWHISPAKDELETNYKRRRQIFKAAECSSSSLRYISATGAKGMTQEHFSSSVLLVRAVLGLDGWLGNTSSCPEVQSEHQSHHLALLPSRQRVFPPATRTLM